MSIATAWQMNQAPSGAACRPVPFDAPAVPLLTELENILVWPHRYKHVAPDGACPSAQECEVCWSIDSASLQRVTPTP